ncbi:hypothetical protein H0H81_002450 [Sphagnurus paluster]|uniref:Uncharacterized protein n=1 Tax=Sphagnurus paluster TaxID=117069 RepID=A0A9P7KLT1_9AGAR|nr:hypothetical protein H0H81_002450 [Sphagnurus paluster]
MQEIGILAKIDPHRSPGPKLASELSTWLNAVEPAEDAYPIQGCKAVIAPSVFLSFQSRLAIFDTAIEELRSTGQFESMSIKADEDEHSIEMHLPYVRKIFEGFSYTYYYPDAAPSDQPAIRLSRSVQPTSSHPIHESISRLDHEAMDLLTLPPSTATNAHIAFAQYLAKTKNTICGRHPIGVLFGALSFLEKEKGINPALKWVRYEQSSACQTVSDSSVSYATPLEVARQLDLAADWLVLPCFGFAPRHAWVMDDLLNFYILKAPFSRRALCQVVPASKPAGLPTPHDIPGTLDAYKLRDGTTPDSERQISIRKQSPGEGDNCGRMADQEHPRVAPGESALDLDRERPEEPVGAVVHLADVLARAGGVPHGAPHGVDLGDVLRQRACGSWTRVESRARGDGREPLGDA